MMARPHTTAAMTNETMTAGPAWWAAAVAPTEKMPAPTATETPRTARSQALRLRLRERVSSRLVAMASSTLLRRARLRRNVAAGRESWLGILPPSGVGTILAALRPLREVYTPGRVAHGGARGRGWKNRAHG